MTPADRDTLLALAERVERARGPAFVIDAKIAAAVGWPDDVVPPAYTTSLDAAMTLVPDGAGFNLDRYWIREGVRWTTKIATGGIPENPRQVFDCWDAYTAPLAIVAAALRARAALLGQGEG